MIKFHFNALTGDTTYVVIKNYGFHLPEDELLKLIMDSTAGYTTAFNGLKDYLEHELNLNLIVDKFSKI